MLWPERDRSPARDRRAGRCGPSIHAITAFETGPKDLRRRKRRILHRKVATPSTISRKHRGSSASSPPGDRRRLRIRPIYIAINVESPGGVDLISEYQSPGESVTGSKKYSSRSSSCGMTQAKKQLLDVERISDFGLKDRLSHFEGEIAILARFVVRAGSSSFRGSW